MTIEEMKKAKEALGYSYEKIADLAQMTPEGVRRIFHGKVQKPRLSTMEALEAVLRPYNVEAYWRFMGERYGEMLDGVWYDKFVPTTIHQMLVGEVYTQIRRQLEEKAVGATAFFSPISVSLHGDLYTMTEPDVIVVRGKDKLKDWGLLGAPDFVFEVLTTAVQKKKAAFKLEHYTRVGVREYWELDLPRREITVYHLEAKAEPAKYQLDGFLSVCIFKGDVTVYLDALTEILTLFEKPKS